MAVQLNANLESSPLIFTRVYTCIRRVCIGVGAAIGINFLKRLQILLTKGAEFPIKQSGRSVRVLSVNVGRNGKYSTGMPTNNTYVLQIPVRRGIFKKFDFHSRPTHPRLFIISSNVSSSLEDYSNFSFFFSAFFNDIHIFQIFLLNSRLTRGEEN